MSDLPNLTYQFNNLSKLFCSYQQYNSKDYTTKDLNSLLNIEEETDAHPYYKATLIKTTWYWQRLPKQITGKEQRPQKWIHFTDKQPIFDKTAKAIQNSKDEFCQQMVLGQCTTICQKKKTRRKESTQRLRSSEKLTKMDRIAKYQTQNSWKTM
jgi:hypothetical protein